MEKQKHLFLRKLFNDVTMITAHAYRLTVTLLSGYVKNSKQVLSLKSKY